MFELIFVIGFVVCFISLTNLRARISKLENGISPQLRPNNEIQNQNSYHAENATLPPKVAVPVMNKVDNNTEDSIGDSFINWIKEDWLLKLGAFMIFVGFVWFVYYAFANNWIGPMGRVALGVIVGAVIMVFGWFRMQKYIRQGSVFLWLGSAVVIMTIYGARVVYDFFDPISALSLMFITTVFIALASLKYKIKSLAFIALLMSAIIPLLTVSSGGTIALFSYLSVIVLGTVWIVSLTGWRFLNLTALIIFFLYSFPYMMSFSSSVQPESKIVLMFIYGFSLLTFIVSLLAVLRKGDEDKQYDISSALLSSIFLLVSILSIENKSYSSLVIVLWMIIYSVGSFLVYRMTGKKENFFIYSCISIAYLGAATAIELSGPALILAYVIEAVLVPIAIYLISKEDELVKRFSLLIAVPIFMSFEYMDTYRWREGVWADGFTVLFFVSVGLFILSYLNYIASRDLQKKNVVVSVMSIIGSVFVFILIWLVSHAGINNNYGSATFISLVTYTLVGLAAYIFGKIKDSKTARVYGIVVMTCVVARLLLVDFSSMTIETRVVTAFVIGAILISSAFISKKKKLN
jgi:uncharacterized membrane protein